MPSSTPEPLSRRAALRRGATGAALAAMAPLSLAARPRVPDLLVRWAEGWSSVTEPDQLLALVAPDIVYEDVAVGDVVKGVEAFRTLLVEAGKAIPDLHIEVFDGFADDAMAAAEYSISGTQTGDLPYLKATDASFRIRSASVFVLANGKIARESRYYDMARFLEQLGALSPANLPKLGTPPATPGG